MFVKKSAGPSIVTLPDGTILSVADLPKPTARWVASRKAVVVNAVTHCLITRDEAIRRYDLSDEEFDSWLSAVERHGREALKITAIQRFRRD